VLNAAKVGNDLEVGVQLLVNFGDKIEIDTRTRGIKAEDLTATYGRKSRNW